MPSDHVRRLHASNGLHLSATPGGCVAAIECGATLVNQVVASPVAGGVHRLYLRAHARGAGDAIRFTEIVGPGAASAFDASPDRFVWSGSWRGIDYRCTCRLHPSGAAWFWHVEAENRSDEPVRCDAVLVQDVGLAARGQVRNNELFTSQYLDHFATRHAEVGHLVMTRQNLPQAGDAHPWLMQGCFPAARGFTTDGFDFFATEYRGDAVPRALAREVIGERVRQYETAYVAIQSSDAELAPGRTSAWTFFAHFLSSHPAASSEADAARLQRVRAMRDELGDGDGGDDETVPMGRPDHSAFSACALLRVDDLDRPDVERLWPSERRHDEAGRSFFHGDGAAHVVLRAKELAVARPHGHVMRAGRGLMPDAEVMSTTCYAAGVFGAQLALGNASLARLLSGVRDPLNVVRSNGLRIFVRDEPGDAWQLLGVPSAFEMALDRCRWLYQRGAEMLTVTCAASDDESKFTFDVRVDGRAVEMLVCGEIAAGPAEYESTPSLSYDAERTRLTVRPDPESPLAKKQPALAFHIESDTAIGGDEQLYEDGASRGLPYFTIRSAPTNALSFAISGSLGGRDNRPTAEPWAFPVVRIDRATQVQDTLTWFARDALVHLSSPRGLEQPNGGAWGVRDVCQGPVEFLLSYDRAGAVADILRAVFAQQYARRGDWPQWFMFPPFEHVQSRHAHGDVVIWPLKALCDYLEHSNDGGAILHERVPYTDDETFARTERSESILEHCDRALRKMRDEFLPGVALPRYGDGDWDDSLQPADPLLRTRMVSAWTAELMYQTLRRYAAALAHAGERDRAATAHEMAADVERDFQRYLMPGGVVAGFAVFAGSSARPVEYLLHPADARTGLRYRLIPMTRGILSGIFTREQANQHLDLIRDHLLFPDGARLMDRPTVYQGGVERTFRRSESAAFFGREIGLQYVHAHLRYAEALAMTGRADEVWRALLVVNPIAVTDVVTNARPRQRNCYFSSSDAAFIDRYEASRDYDKLRRGEVPVDAGWRIYSSGPGIYTSLVIRHLFGLRRHFDQVEFDPVLPKELDGTTLELVDAGSLTRYRFTAGAKKSVTVNGRPLPTSPIERNPFRSGGMRVDRGLYDAALAAGENLVEIVY